MNGDKTKKYDGIKGDLFGELRSAEPVKKDEQSASKKWGDEVHGFCRDRFTKHREYFVDSCCYDMEQRRIVKEWTIDRFKKRDGVGLCDVSRGRKMCQAVS